MLTYRDAKRRMFKKSPSPLSLGGGIEGGGGLCGGALRGNSAPQGRTLPAWGVAENKNGRSPFLVGAWGACPPLYDFYLLIF